MYDADCVCHFHRLLISVRMMAMFRQNTLHTVTEEVEIDSSPGTPTPSSSRASPENYSPNKQALDYLTTKRLSKLDKYDKRKERVKNSPPKVQVICKWFSTFFIAACLLLCVTVVKLTVISLAHKLYFDTDPESDVTEAAKAFVTLLLIVLVPYLATFIRSAWTVFGRKDLPWPRLSAIIWVGTFSNTKKRLLGNFCSIRHVAITNCSFRFAFSLWATFAATLQKQLHMKLCETFS